MPKGDSLKAIPGQQDKDGGSLVPLRNCSLEQWAETLKLMIKRAAEINKETHRNLQKKNKPGKIVGIK